jgi:hypothetical protein
MKRAPLASVDAPQPKRRCMVRYRVRGQTPPHPVLRDPLVPPEGRFVEQKTIVLNRASWQMLAPERRMAEPWHTKESASWAASSWRW